MHEIRLTPKQNNRIVQMCKFLFPELQKKALDKGTKYYDDIVTAKFNCGFYITGIGNIQCSYPYYDRDDSFHIHLIGSIPWLEMCIYHLPEKLFENFRPKWEESEEPFEDFSVDGSGFGSDDIVIQMINNINEINPIDYLYDNVYKKYVRK